RAAEGDGDLRLCAPTQTSTRVSSAPSPIAAPSRPPVCPCPDSAWARVRARPPCVSALRDGEDGLGVSLERLPQARGRRLNDEPRALGVTRGAALFVGALIGPGVLL